jgi:hypothetical protein
MSAEQALFDAYREWLRLARATHRAIGKRDWTFLLECQRVIQEMQPAVSRLTEAARKEWKQQKVDGEAKEKKLRRVILELVEMVDSNHELLQTCRTEALFQRQKLEQAGRNLKRLQNSYALSRSSAWTSFS